VFVDWIAEVFERCYLLRRNDALPASIAQYLTPANTEPQGADISP
jgi:hypothetical protein